MTRRTKHVIGIYVVAYTLLVLSDVWFTSSETQVQPITKGGVR